MKGMISKLSKEICRQQRSFQGAHIADQNHLYSAINVGNLHAGMENRHLNVIGVETTWITL